MSRSIVVITRVTPQRRTMEIRSIRLQRSAGCISQVARSALLLGDGRPHQQRLDLHCSHVWDEETILRTIQQRAAGGPQTVRVGALRALNQGQLEMGPTQAGARRKVAP